MKISSQGFHFKWSQAEGGRPQVGVGVGPVLLSAGRYEYAAKESGPPRAL
jgi:hypothetical protein